jgi:hypothetical protein
MPVSHGGTNLLDNGWHLTHGRWWMVQWQVDGWLSLGIHIDLRRRIDSDGHSYGPYIDFHLGFVILSLGYHPVYSGEMRKAVSVSRGGR